MQCSSALSRAADLGVDEMLQLGLFIGRERLPGLAQSAIVS